MVPPQIYFHLSAHLAPVHIIGSFFEQGPNRLRLEHIKNTLGRVVNRCSLSSHDCEIAEREEHDGDMRTAATHYLEKLNGIVACLGCLRQAGKIHDFMIHARARMMSRI